MCAKWSNIQQMRVDAHIKEIGEYQDPKNCLQDGFGSLVKRLVHERGGPEMERRTLENMCVIGLVTLMLRRPAMQSKKPNKPVTKHPQMNTIPFHSTSLILVKSRGSSLCSTTNGNRNIAEPALVHHANCMVELLQ